MKKLINGIIEFRKKSLSDYRKKFSELATRPSADALFIACCDSRVVPNTFASTDPGDLFVLRNIGNFVNPYHDLQDNMTDMADTSVTAAVEFAMQYLKVKDIIICGHSECAAIKTIVNNQQASSPEHLKRWLRYGEPAFSKFQNGFHLNSTLTPCNEVSQINVLQQLEHLKTYPIVKTALENHSVNVHGWWFELDTANVYQYQDQQQRFTVIDEQINIDEY